MKWIFLVFVTTFFNAQINSEALLLGTKKIGVQFIFDGYGKAVITKKDKVYEIKGEQYSKDKTEYCLLNGTLEMKDVATLKFTSELKLFTKDCCGEIVKNTPFTFFSSVNENFGAYKNEVKFVMNTNVVIT